MIAELSVSQIAIIEHTTVALRRGFTVLTGETGAGKSLLIDAIQLALGERADTELIRSQAKSGSVSVVFDLSDRLELQRLCEELGIALEDSQLFVTRELFTEGRSQCRIGGRLMPAAVLRQLGDALVDLHGQHDHQSLLRQERHLEYLDLWIGEECLALRKLARERFASYSDACRRLDLFRAQVQQRDRTLDLLNFQIGEIEQVAPQVGEFEALQATLVRLQNSEALYSATQTARQELYEAEGSALEAMGVAMKSLESAQRYDEKLGLIAAQLREAVFQVEDIAASLGKFTDSLESSPDALEEVSTRLDALKKLRRKYGENEEAILELLTGAKQQLSSLEDDEASEAALEAERETSSAQLRSVSEQLSQLRRTKSREFAEQIESELEQLSLPKARFAVGIKPGEPGPHGGDEVEFVFSANPGEPLRPLQRVASGGEVSRLMLAMKTVLAGRAGVPTLIFDEIDSGLGGRVGSIVGQKLAELSASYQVLAISHLPQVAAAADFHFKIEKIESGGRITTSVRELAPLERQVEIARMLAGESIGETALAHARELLGPNAAPP